MMIIAISTDGEFVSAHFGRCPSFTLVNIEKNSVISKTTISNPGHEPGVIPNFLNEKGAKQIICGGMGARASQMFNDLGITVITGIEGKVDYVIEKIIKSELHGGQSLCTPGAGRGYGIEKAECDHANDE